MMAMTTDAGNVADDADFLISKLKKTNSDINRIAKQRASGPSISFNSIEQESTTWEDVLKEARVLDGMIDSILVSPQKINKRASRIDVERQQQAQDADNTENAQELQLTEEEIKELCLHPWFVGRVSDPQANDLLKDSLPGAFLIRQTGGAVVLTARGINDLVDVLLKSNKKGRIIFAKSTFSSLEDLVNRLDSDKGRLLAQLVVAEDDSGGSRRSKSMEDDRIIVSSFSGVEDAERNKQSSL